MAQQVSMAQQVFGQPRFEKLTEKQIKTTSNSPNAYSIFTMQYESYGTGLLLEYAMREDPNVIKATYNVPNPKEAILKFHCQTKKPYQPKQALTNALKKILSDFDQLEQQIKTF